MSRYKDSQYLRQGELIKTSPNIFSGDKGNGFLWGNPDHLFFVIELII